MVHINGQDVWVSNGKESLVLTMAQAVMVIGQLATALENAGYCPYTEAAKEA